MPSGEVPMGRPLPPLPREATTPRPRKHAWVVGICPASPPTWIVHVRLLCLQLQWYAHGPKRRQRTAMGISPLGILRVLGIREGQQACCCVVRGVLYVTILLRCSVPAVPETTHLCLACFSMFLVVIPAFFSPCVQSVRSTPPAIFSAVVRRPPRTSSGKYFFKCQEYVE